MTRLRDHVSVTETDEGMAILDERSGDYFVVNGLGAVVIHRLLAGADVSEIVEDVQRDHPQEADQVERDVRNFVEALDAAGVTE